MREGDLTRKYTRSFALNVHAATNFRFPSDYSARSRCHTLHRISIRQAFGNNVCNVRSVSFIDVEHTTKHVAFSDLYIITAVQSIIAVPTFSRTAARARGVELTTNIIKFVRIMEQPFSDKIISGCTILTFYPLQEIDC